MQLIGVLVSDESGLVCIYNITLKLVVRDVAGIIIYLKIFQTSKSD